MTDEERKEELTELINAVNKYLGTNDTYEDYKERANSKEKSPLHDYFSEEVMVNYFD